MSHAARRIAHSTPFAAVIFTVIVANGVVLGLGTYDSFDREAGNLLDTLNDVFLGIFVVELAIRIAAHGRRPGDFFRSGWNVFDFTIIAAAFLPGLGANPTLLRLLRLLRVVRLVSLLPDLRVLTLAVWRAIPPALSIGVLAVLLVYVYGMIGWQLFGDELPDDWGNVGEAMLTLFVLLTLENLPTYLEEAQGVHAWSWVYFVTFAMAASFLLLNVLIGIVINSMEEARAIEEDRERQAHPGSVEVKVAALRAAVDDLEEELRARARR